MNKMCKINLSVEAIDLTLFYYEIGKEKKIQFGRKFLVCLQNIDQWIYYRVYGAYTSALSFALISNSKPRTFINTCSRSSWSYIRKLTFSDTNVNVP